MLPKETKRKKATIGAEETFVNKLEGECFQREVSMKGICNPNEHDVLCGRGGATLRHPGNKKYRSLISSIKPTYLISRKEEKTAFSRSIVAAIRNKKGRFLERAKDQTWYDIGDAKATEKTSQTLREGQPELRQKMINNGIIKDSSTSPPGSIDRMSSLHAMGTSAMSINKNDLVRDGSDSSFNNVYRTHMKNNQYSSLGHSLNRLIPGKDAILHSDQQQIFGRPHPSDYLVMLREKHHLDHRKVITMPPPHMHRIHATRHNEDCHQSRHFSCDKENEMEDIDIDNNVEHNLNDSHSTMTFEMDMDEIFDDDSRVMLRSFSTSSPVATHLRALSEWENNEPIEIERHHVIETSFSSHRSENNNPHHHHHHHSHQPENRDFDRNTFRDDLEDMDDDDDSGCISLQFVSSLMFPTEANPQHMRHTF